MRFYYENGLGDKGYFSEKDLIKAVYTAWNIEADLWLLNDGVKKLDKNGYAGNQGKLIFASTDGCELNSDLLGKFGYYMTEDCEIKRISDDVEVKYDWSEVKQLI